jgi:hypothetical protein
MTATGDVAKGILIFCCGYFVLIAIEQAASGQTALAAFMFVGLMIPLSFVIYSYAKDKREKRSSLNNSEKDMSRQTVEK